MFEVADGDRKATTHKARGQVRAEMAEADEAVADDSERPVGHLEMKPVGSARVGDVHRLVSCQNTMTLRSASPRFTEAMAALISSSG